MQWSGKTGGTPWMQRALVVIFRHTDVRVVYAVMSVWLLWYMAVRPRATRAVYRFHHIHRGRNIRAACIDTYRSYYNFGEAIMDRFAAFAGKQFHVETGDAAGYTPLLHSKEGLLMLFSHEGNTEMAGYHLASPDKRMNILAYMAESETVTQNRMEVLERNNLRIIPMYPHETGHVYAVSNAISNGEIVAMAADRIIDGKGITCRFFGREAHFPAGPFRMCVAAKRPVLVVFVIKSRWDTYRVHISELTTDAHLPHKEQAAALAQRYAERLETMARKHPYQWFNFYDFWETE